MQIHVVVSELTYASLAGYVNPRSAGSGEGSSENIFPALVASEIGASRVFRAAWSGMERELRAY